MRTMGRPASRAFLFALLCVRCGCLRGIGRGIGLAGTSPLFPEDTPGPDFVSRLSFADIPGVWELRDRLCAVDAAKSDGAAYPPRQGMAMESPATTIVLGIDGNVLRSTSMSNFVTGKWRFIRPDIGSCRLEIDVINKFTRQRLLYRGRIREPGIIREPTDLSDEPESREERIAREAAMQASLCQPLSAFGQIEHLKSVMAAGVDDDDDDDDDEIEGYFGERGSAAPRSNEEEFEDVEVVVSSESREYLGGSFAMRQIVQFGRPGGEKPKYICSVGPNPSGPLRRRRD
jgi:hypothetical protein